MFWKRLLRLLGRRPRGETSAVGEDEVADLEEGAETTLGRAVGYLERISAERGSDGRERYPIPQQCELTVGRLRSSDIVLRHPSVSREHAMVRQLDNGDIEIEDRDSMNGVFVNGRRVGTRALRDGDEIEVGDVVLVFRVVERTRARLDAALETTGDESDDEHRPIPFPHAAADR